MTPTKKLKSVTFSSQIQIGMKNKGPSTVKRRISGTALIRKKAAPLSSVASRQSVRARVEGFDLWGVSRGFSARFNDRLSEIQSCRPS